MVFEQNKRDILKKIIKEREIKNVLHFTRLSNLDSILKNGLKSRKYLETIENSSTFNDEYRHDGCKEAICCSLCYPNYKMFYSLRQENPKEEWVVIGIRESILWEKDCAFCVENAASNNVTAISLAERKGKKALKKIFKEDEIKPTRKELGLKDSCPTNPQAEILVFDDIEPENIFGVVFQSSNRVAEYKKLYKGFQFIYSSSYFSPRPDWKHWQN